MTGYIFLAPCFSFVSVAEIEHNDQKQLGEKGFIFVWFVIHHRGSSRQELKAGTWSQEWKQRLWSKAASWLPPRPLSTTQNHLPGTLWRQTYFLIYLKKRSS